MKKTLRNFAIFLFVGFLYSSCGDSNNKKMNSDEKAEIEEKGLENETDNMLCFRNEFPYQDNPTMKDIVELKLEIKGEKVTGIYNWLPAEKDKREGRLTGDINNKIIEAKYTFRQEGFEDSTELTIYIDSLQAKIKGGAPELGLETTIKKIDCD